MPNFMTLTLDDVTAEKESQIHEVRSAIERSEEIKTLAAKIKETPDCSETWMCFGLAFAKQKLFREAIAAFSRAVALDPFKAIVYRHRGHRLLSIHRFEEAVADFEIGSRLDPENWDIWYHLGLSYYLVGEYQKSVYAYINCVRVTDSTEKLVAVLDWYWTTLIRLGRRAEADALLEPVNKDTEYGENYSYYRRILLYKGEVRPEELMDFEGAPFPALEIATQGYGLANYYFANGKDTEARTLLTKIVETAGSDMWSAFGYLAALVDIENGR